LIGNLSCSINSRRILLNTVFISFLFLFFFTILYFLSLSSNRITPSLLQKPSQGSFSKPFHDIKRFNYTRTVHGQAVFSIQADRFKIEKAKLGLFRFAFMKQVVFNNARIKIIHPGGQNKDSLMSVFHGRLLSDFNTKASVNMVFKPIEVRVMSEAGKLLTKITSDSALLDTKKQQLSFKDNVKIKSGSNLILSQTFKVFLKSGNAVAQEGYHLITPEKNRTGSRLLTDIFLTTFNDDSSGGPGP